MTAYVVFQCQVIIHAAYGSVKDISVYSSIGVLPHQIYSVGKHHPRKYAKHAQVSSQYHVFMAACVPLPGVNMLRLMKVLSRLFPTIKTQLVDNFRWQRTRNFHATLQYRLDLTCPCAIHSFTYQPISRISMFIIFSNIRTNL